MSEKGKIKIAFYDSKSYDIESFTALNDKRIKFTFIESKMNLNTVSLSKDHDAVCVFVNDVLSKDVIRKLKSYGIKLILLRCAGFNNVDIECAHKNNIDIYRVPAYSPHAVAEHAFAMLQTINRRIHKAYIRTREYNFSLEGLTGMDLYNKTIGIIGTGKIGRVMIDIAKGYKMKIIAYDPYPNESLDIKYVNIDDLFREADIISLHCPLNSDNKYIINENSIKLMKKGVILINTSRGALINSKDLYLGLISRKIGAACLDVYEEEGDIFYENKSNHILDDITLSLLISLPNVIVTSHQGFLTKEALKSIAMTTSENAINYFNHLPNTQNQVV